jgi:hypothetical protein
VLVVRQELLNCLRWGCNGRISSSLQRENARRIYHSACRELEFRSRFSGVHETMAGVRSYGGRPILFAGAVRDELYAALTGIPALPRDYDIGVAQMSRDCFVAFANSLGAARNRYGGYQFHARDGLNIDLWRIEDTVGILAVSCRPTIALRANIAETLLVPLITEQGGKEIQHEEHEDILSGLGRRAQ